MNGKIETKVSISCLVGFSACDVSTPNSDESKVGVSYSPDAHERSSGTSVVDNATLSVKASSVSNLRTSGLECRFGSSSPEKQTSTCSVKLESDETGVPRGPSSEEQSTHSSAKKTTDKSEEQRSVSKANVALKDTDEQTSSSSVKPGSERNGAQASPCTVEQAASPSSEHRTASAANAVLSDMGEQANASSVKTGADKDEARTTVSFEESLSPSGDAFTVDVALNNTEQQSATRCVEVRSHEREAQTGFSLEKQTANPSVKEGTDARDGQANAFTAEVSLNQTEKQSSTPYVEVRSETTEVQSRVSIEEHTANPFVKEGTDAREEETSVFIVNVALNETEENSSTTGSFGKVQSGESIGQMKAQIVDVARNDTEDQNSTISVKVGTPKHEEGTTAFAVDVASEPEEPANMVSLKVVSDEDEELTVDRALSAVKKKEGGDSSVAVLVITESGPSNLATGRIDAKVGSYHPWNSDSGKKRPRSRAKSATPKSREGRQKSNTKSTVKACDSKQDQAETEQGREGVNHETTLPVSESMTPEVSTTGRSSRSSLGTTLSSRETSGAGTSNALLDISTASASNERCFSAKRSGDVPSRATSQASIRAPSAQFQERLTGDTDERRPPASQLSDVLASKEGSTTQQTSRDQGSTTSCQSLKHEGSHAGSPVREASNVTASQKQSSSYQSQADLPTSSSSRTSVVGPSNQARQRSASATSQKRSSISQISFAPDMDERSCNTQSSGDARKTPSERTLAVSPYKAGQRAESSSSQRRSSVSQMSFVTDTDKRSCKVQSPGDTRKTPSERSLAPSPDKAGQRAESSSSQRRSSVSQVSFVTDTDKQSCNAQSSGDARKTLSERSLAPSPYNAGQRAESSSSQRRSSVSQMSFVTDTDKRSCKVQSPGDARKTPSEKTLAPPPYKAGQRTESSSSQRRSSVSQMSFVSDVDGTSCNAQSSGDARKTPSERSLAPSPDKAGQRTESSSSQRRSSVSQMSFVTDTDKRSCKVQSPGDARKTPSEKTLAPSPYKAGQRTESSSSQRRSSVSQMSFVSDVDGTSCNAQSSGDARKTPSERTLAVSPYKAGRRAESSSSQRRSSVSQMSFVTDTDKRSCNAQSPGDVHKTPSERTLAVSPYKAGQRAESSSSQRRLSVSQMSFVSDAGGTSCNAQSSGDARKTPSERTLAVSPYKAGQRAESSSSQRRSSVSQMSFITGDARKTPSERTLTASSYEAEQRAESATRTQRQGDVRSASSDKTLRATSGKTTHRAASAASQANSSGFQQISNISAFSERPGSRDSQRSLRDKLTPSPHQAERHASSAMSQTSSPISGKIVCETALNECLNNTHSPTDLCFGATPSPYQTEQSATSQRGSPVYEEVSYAADSNEYAFGQDISRELGNIGSGKETFSGLLERCARREASIKVQKAILLNQDISCSTAFNERPPTAHGARATEVRSLTQLLEASERRVSVVNSLKASVADKDFFTTASPKRPSSAQCSRDAVGNSASKIGIAELLSQSEKRAASISGLKTSVASKDLSCSTASNEGHFGAQPVELGTSPAHSFSSSEMRPRTASSKAQSCSGFRCSPSVE